jgi:hypothetical protein
VARGGKRQGSGRKKREEVVAEVLTDPKAGLAIREVEGESPMDMLLRFMRGEKAEHYLWDGDKIVTEDDKVTGELKAKTYWAPLPLKDRLSIARSLAPYYESKHAPKPPKLPAAGEGLTEGIVDWVNNLDLDQVEQLEGLIRAGSGIASREGEVRAPAGKSQAPSKRQRH